MCIINNKNQGTFKNKIVWFYKEHTHSKLSSVIKGLNSDARNPLRILSAKTHIAEKHPMKKLTADSIVLKNYRPCRDRELRCVCVCASDLRHLRNKCQVSQHHPPSFRTTRSQQFKVHLYFQRLESQRVHSEGFYGFYWLHQNDLDKSFIFSDSGSTKKFQGSSMKDILSEEQMGHSQPA